MMDEQVANDQIYDSLSLSQMNASQTASNLIHLDQYQSCGLITSAAKWGGEPHVNKLSPKRNQYPNNVSQDSISSHPSLHITPKNFSPTALKKRD